MLILILFAQSLMIEGLSEGELQWRESGDYQYEIAISLDGEIVSQWIMYPLRFNMAKLFCEYNADESTLEVTSQMPYTSEYTYARYLVEENWNLHLFEKGESDYYGDIRRRVEELLAEGYLEDAASYALDTMYPGSMPYPHEFCALFVIAAAEIGNLEAFEVASNVTDNFIYGGIQGIECSSEDFQAALLVYAEAVSFTDERLTDE